MKGLLEHMLVVIIWAVLMLVLCIAVLLGCSSMARISPVSMLGPLILVIMRGLLGHMWVEDMLNSLQNMSMLLMHMSLRIINMIMVCISKEKEQMLKLLKFLMKLLFITLWSCLLTYRFL